MVGEAAGDHYRAQLVIETAVFSSGHPPTLTGRTDTIGDDSAAGDVERLAAHDGVHRAVELGLGFADHVLA
ncbi:hypothetical protein MMAGJ_01700 [Mycolicibacterium mageritense]|uniref:Uncharacterized protein n=1 Tax=Mycolicibacterium mageritense TaxID=53462 RepID=A0ABM7HK83_MYCME|nr:hypothetical protein MMAGJ_01700 [Mycolicibacterium mageritense]